jgi:omega-amidase
MSTLTLTIIQTDLIWEDISGNLNKLETRINALKGKTELVLLPEMFSTGFCVNPVPFAEKMDGKTVNWMKLMAMSNKLILTGSVIIEDGGHYFNRLIWMLPDGTHGYYDKRHLFAFAGEDERYSPGAKRLIASIKGWRILLLICYDLRFPVWARQSRQADPENSEIEYDLMIYVANWPERRNLAWKTLLQARAIENQAFVAGVNRIGIDGNNISYQGDSMLIDPMGKILYSAPVNVEDTFTYILEKEPLNQARTTFPFWKDRDRFFIEP